MDIIKHRYTSEAMAEMRIMSDGDESRYLAFNASFLIRNVNVTRRSKRNVTIIIPRETDSAVISPEVRTALSARLS